MQARPNDLFSVICLTGAAVALIGGVLIVRFGDAGFIVTIAVTVALTVAWARRQRLPHGAKIADQTLSDPRGKYRGLDPRTVKAARRRADGIE